MRIADERPRVPAAATRAIEARLEQVRDVLDSPARTTRTTVVVGRLLGLAFVVCFATGLYSHALQDPLPWMTFPTRPVQLYQWTQGLHVIAGTVAMPLLLAKLWVVYPRLFSWPPVRSPLHALERVSIAVLVSTSLVQVAIGFLNTLQWYPWEFSFRRVHLALAWIVIGSLVVHIGTHLPQIVEHWRARPAADEPPSIASGADGAPSPARDDAEAPTPASAADGAPTPAAATEPRQEQP
ncbi:cytochrome b/b6 domain-containing protein [Agrococcus versicolor]|uniref:cytochrome b/b6 domain-containing protein n=1 Tax=Agrococcus versicolor TaxID=501482 RepID=UPI0031D7D6FE